MKVAAGCYQQGANPQGDSINVGWTQAEVDYALAQAAQYGNVEELIIGSECVWGPNSTAAITSLLAYAKVKRPSDAIKVTTRQRWDVLAGVGNTTPGYAPTRQAIINMLAACEGHVYADIYPYFDPGIAAAIGQTPTKATVEAVVQASFAGSYGALSTAFSQNGVTAAIRIGETGWPTSGSQAAQPDGAIASRSIAHWAYEAISAWLGMNKVEGFAFEAYDEPWKGPAGNSEAHFGIWEALGSASSPSNYTLTGEVQKYVL